MKEDENECARIIIRFFKLVIAFLSRLIRCLRGRKKESKKERVLVRRREKASEENSVDFFFFFRSFSFNLIVIYIVSFV